MTEKSKIFETEIAAINDTKLRNFVEYYLDTYAPDYFFEIGASSSGRYHPKFAQGEGGLVKHTKAVCMFAEELLRLSSYAYMKDIYKDYVRLACIVHDTCKYGMYEYDKSEYANHAKNAAELVKTAWHDREGGRTELSELIYSAIASHMGQWTTDKEDRPFTNIDRCVHLADYMASRNFIDIPSLSVE